MSSVDDPLAQFENPEQVISPDELGVAMEDWGLFEQLRRDPRINNITDEIALNRYLRIKLMREAEFWAHDKREELAEKIQTAAEKLADGKLSLDQFSILVEKALPSMAMSVDHIKALSKLLETSGKLVEQQKKITEGITLKVDIADAGVIQRLFTHVIRPALEGAPEEYWAAIMVRARSFAPQLTGINVIDIDNDPRYQA